jgi:ribosomal protein S18 acetylase RimI-like enzyme
MLAVDPAAQGRGVGRALSLACVERARSVAAQRVALHSTSWMVTAHRLYESIGFVRTPERDLRVSPELVLMSFILALSYDH